MLLSNSKRAFLLFLVGGALLIQASPPDGALNSLLPTFRLIDGTGGSETGRCTGADLDHLKASYEDMCIMARTARDEIDFLMDQAERTRGSGPPKPENKEAPQTDIDNWKRWNRVRATYLSMFGKDPFLAPGDPQAGKPVPGHKTFVRDFYQRVDTEFCIGHNDNSPLLVCTDAHFKFIKIGQVDPGDTQGRNIENTQPQCSNVGGVWYSPNMPDGERYEFGPPPEKPGNGPYCDDPNHLAVSLKAQRIIIFCKDGLDTEVHSLITLQDQRNDIKQSNKPYKRMIDRDILRQALGRSQLTKLEDIKGDGKENMPLTWLHELHHILKNSNDERAVDKHGNRIKTTERSFNPVTRQYEDENVDKKAYGYKLARDLALYGGLSAMINPENAAFFALAMFFGEHDWSRGFAMPLADPFKK